MDNSSNIASSTSNKQDASAPAGGNPLKSGDLGAAQNNNNNNNNNNHKKLVRLSPSKTSSPNNHNKDLNPPGSAGPSPSDQNHPLLSNPDANVRPLPNPAILNLDHNNESNPQSSLAETTATTVVAPNIKITNASSVNAAGTGGGAVGGASATGNGNNNNNNTNAPNQALLLPSNSRRAHQQNAAAKSNTVAEQRRKRRRGKSNPLFNFTRYYTNQQHHRAFSYHIGSSPVARTKAGGDLVNPTSGSNRKLQQNSKNNRGVNSRTNTTSLAGGGAMHRRGSTTSANSSYNTTGATSSHRHHHHNHNQFVDPSEELRTLRDAIEVSTTLENSIRFHNESLVDNIHRSLIKLDNPLTPEPVGTYPNLLFRNPHNKIFVIVKPTSLVQYAPHPLSLVIHPHVNNQAARKHVLALMQQVGPQFQESIENPNTAVVVVFPAGYSPNINNNAAGACAAAATATTAKKSQIGENTLNNSPLIISGGKTNNRAGANNLGEANNNNNRNQLNANALAEQQKLWNQQHPPQQQHEEAESGLFGHATGSTALPMPTGADSFLDGKLKTMFSEKDAILVASALVRKQQQQSNENILAAISGGNDNSGGNTSTLPPNSSVSAVASPRKRQIVQEKISPDELEKLISKRVAAVALAAGNNNNVLNTSKSYGTKGAAAATGGSIQQQQTQLGTSANLNNNNTVASFMMNTEKSPAAIDFNFVYPPRPMLADPFFNLPAVAPQFRECPALRLLPTQVYKPVLRLGRGAYGETWLVEARPHLRDQQKVQTQQAEELKRIRAATARAEKEREKQLKELDEAELASIVHPLNINRNNNNNNTNDRNGLENVNNNNNNELSANVGDALAELAGGNKAKEGNTTVAEGLKQSKSNDNTKKNITTSGKTKKENQTDVNSTGNNDNNNNNNNNPLASSVGSTASPPPQISHLASTGPIRLKNGYEIAASNAFVCKVINRESSTFSQVANEVNILADVAHPCIVAFIEGYVETGRMNLVMEYVDGGDLRKEIDDRRAVPPGQTQKRFTPENNILTIFSQTCLAIEYLHRFNILHRDLKPENMIVSKKWLLKIADFGLAKKYDNDIAIPTGTSFVGTPGYVAPEVWLKKGFTEKSDIFSLGCILYELITLDRPFPSHGLAKRDEIPDNLDTCERRPITRMEISRDLKELCDWLLEPDPANRPTALEVLRVPLIMSAAQDFVKNFSRSAGHDPVDKRWAEILEDQLNEVMLSDCATSKDLRQERRSTAAHRTMQVRSSFMTTRSQQQMSRIATSGIKSNQGSPSGFSAPGARSNNNNNNNHRKRSVGEGRRSGAAGARTTATAAATASVFEETVNSNDNESLGIRETTASAARNNNNNSGRRGPSSNNENNNNNNNRDRSGFADDDDGISKNDSYVNRNTNNGNDDD